MLLFNASLSHELVIVLDAPCDEFFVNASPRFEYDEQIVFHADYKDYVAHFIEENEATGRARIQIADTILKEWRVQWVDTNRLQKVQ